MRKLCLVLSLLVASVFGATAASAQDRWPFNGLYVGVHGGYSWQSASGVFDNKGFPTNLTGLDLNGGILGGQLGYNIQYGWWMIGIEGDASAHPENNSVTSPTGIMLTSDSGYLASIRGRIGFVIYDWLIFGTAGVGFTKTEFQETAPNLAFNGKLSFQNTGAVYGGGVEWAFARGVTIRTEYLHYDAGGTAAIPTTFLAADSGDYVKFSGIDVVRAALNISLNP